MASCTYLRHTVPRYHGLVNQGSTCYLNSVLQVLFMTKDFREALKSCGDESLDSRLRELFQELEKNTAYTFNITNKLGITRDFVQSDAAECLEKILRNVTSPGASQLFQGRQTQKNKCCKCEKETKTDDPFWNLPLELTRGHRDDYKVVDGIDRYFSESEVSGPNQLYCDFCQEKTDSTFKFEINHHPEVLTLMLKRFKFDSYHLDYVKINCSVEIPYILEIPATDTMSQTYELYAFVDHVGSLKNGHYTVAIKSQDDEEWYRFNDSQVTLLSYQPFQVDFNEMSRWAYLLFYKKVSAADAPAENPTETSTSDTPAGNPTETSTSDTPAGNPTETSTSDTPAGNPTETSTSEASEPDRSDKPKKDEHEEEDTQKGQVVEAAAVNHYSVVKEETEEKSREDARKYQKEGPAVENQLNKEEVTKPKFLTKFDLVRSHMPGDVRASQGKQKETSAFNQEQKLKSTNATPRKHKQEREVSGDMVNKKMKTGDEHSDRRNKDVADDGGDNSDARPPSGRLDPHSTDGFKDQTSRKNSNHLLVIERECQSICYQYQLNPISGSPGSAGVNPSPQQVMGRGRQSISEERYVVKKYLILRKGCAETTECGDNQRSKQNVEEEPKKDASDKLAHCLPSACSHGLNGHEKDDRSVQTRGESESNHVPKITSRFERLNDSRSGNLSERVVHQVKGCPTTQIRLQRGVNAETSQVEEVGGTARCAQKAGHVESLSRDFKKMSLKDSSGPQGQRDKDRNGKIENITEGERLTELNAGNTGQVSPPTQVQDVTDEPHPSDGGRGVWSLINSFWAKS